MRRPCDIEAVNELAPDYCGFILSAGFRRSIAGSEFRQLRSMLGSGIKAVGVFVNEDIETLLRFADQLDLIQLHGSEDEQYIDRLRSLCGKPIIKAFRIAGHDDIIAAAESIADHVLLDSGTGSGRSFDHSLITDLGRDYFLAGGLTADSVGSAIAALRPFAVDASSCLETEGCCYKDKNKMTEFVNAVRRKDI